MKESGKLNVSEGKYEGIHKAVLSGFLSNIAMRKEKNMFRAGKGRDVMIFPGSGLFNQAGSWVVAAEMVETSRVFARTVANIDNGWLEPLGGDLCRRTYLEPHWEKNRGEVVASEQVSLFGLIIEPGRKVSYGKVNPAEADECCPLLRLHTRSHCCPQSWPRGICRRNPGRVHASYPR